MRTVFVYTAEQHNTAQTHTHTPTHTHMVQRQNFPIPICLAYYAVRANENKQISKKTLATATSFEAGLSALPTLSFSLDMFMHVQH